MCTLHYNHMERCSNAFYKYIHIKGSESFLLCMCAVDAYTESSVEAARDNNPTFQEGVDPSSVKGGGSSTIY